MSWISDVREEIQHLDLSKKSLKKSGLLVGFVLLLIAGWMLLKHRFHNTRLILGCIGLVLMVLGVLAPFYLKSIYKFWMGIAFALGWIVSRVLLLILFFIIITPIGLLMRIFGKDFLDIKSKRKRDSYWIPKEKEQTLNYKKMY